MIVNIQIQTVKLVSIINTVNTVVKAYGNLPSNTDGRCGGYLTVADPISGGLQLVMPIGEIAPVKLHKYCTFSQEKDIRLRRELNNGHMSSWESRDPENDKWGGAIYAYKYIYSFSGLPELADEAVMLITAILEKDLPKEMADNIAERSKNPIYHELLTAMKIE